MTSSHTKLSGACVSLALATASFNDTTAQDYRAEYQPHSHGYNQREPHPSRFEYRSIYAHPSPTQRVTSDSVQTLPPIHSHPQWNTQGSRGASYTPTHRPEHAPHSNRDIDYRDLTPGRYESPHQSLVSQTNRNHYQAPSEHQQSASDPSKTSGVTPHEQPSGPGWSEFVQAIGTIASCIHNAIMGCNPYVLLAGSLSLPYLLRQGMVAMARSTMSKLRSEAHLGDTTLIER